MELSFPVRSSRDDTLKILWWITWSSKWLLSHTFALHHREDLHPAPLVFVPDLVALVFQYLERNQRYSDVHGVLTCTMYAH